MPSGYCFNAYNMIPKKKKIKESSTSSSYSSNENIHGNTLDGASERGNCRGASGYMPSKNNGYMPSKNKKSSKSTAKWYNNPY